MAKTSAQDYPQGLTFEQVWAALMEQRESQREMWAKAEQERREQQESQREMWAKAEQERREQQESQRETWAKAEQERREQQESLRETWDKISREMEKLESLWSLFLCLKILSLRSGERLEPLGRGSRPPR